MAKTYVENARVERVFETSTGWGAAVKEERTVGDRVFTLWVTLWFKSRPEISAGDVVNASGYLSVKSKVLDNGRAASDVNLNGAVIQSVQQGAAPEEPSWSQGPPAEDGWPSSDSWGA